jgi:hypothetical protein
MINSPKASSAWFTSPPPDTGSNLSTPPNLADAIIAAGFLFERNALLN